MCGLSGLFHDLPQFPKPALQSLFLHRYRNLNPPNGSFFPMVNRFFHTSRVFYRGKDFPFYLINLIFPISGTSFSSSLIAAINPITQHTSMKIPQSHPTQGIIAGNENNKITRAWFRWNFAPSLSPVQIAIKKPIHVIYATIPVVLASIILILLSQVVPILRSTVSKAPQA